jgi:hypothetical protein
MYVVVGFDRYVDVKSMASECAVSAVLAPTTYKNSGIISRMQ